MSVSLLRIIRRAGVLSCPRVTACCRARMYSVVESIEHPSSSGDPKLYSDHIRKLVTDISKLTLIEVADLNELLKKTLNIPDTPMFGAMPMMASPQAQEEEVEEAPMVAVKTSFTLKLMKFDDTKKVALIKEIKNTMEGFNLVQAKKFVEGAPQVIRADIAKEEAESLQKTLQAVGATCEIV